MPPNYVYVITRRDLSLPQQAVQAAHAVIESSRHFGHFTREQEHPHLVLCAVENERHLSQAASKLRGAGLSITEWREPDQGNALTAIASPPVSGDARKLFKRYQLLNPEVRNAA